MFRCVRFTRAESGKTTRKNSTSSLVVKDHQAEVHLAFRALFLRLVFDYTVEKIRFEFRVARIARGGEMERFERWHLAEVLAHPRKQRLLRQVLHERLILALKPFCADFDAR